MPIQNSKVFLNDFFEGSSAFAVATAAKQGIVSILNAMNAISPGTPMPVALIISVTAIKPPSASTSIIPPTMQAARVPNVAITFSFAIRPVIAATANTQPKLFASCEPNPNGVNKGLIIPPIPARIL